jgi:glucosamine--fructose-6-phosphate aminotransferase (isomerizing)
MWVVPDNYVGSIYFDRDKSVLVFDGDSSTPLSRLSCTEIPEGVKFRSKSGIHHTLREIQEQVHTLQNKIDVPVSVAEKLQSCQNLTFLACGSSKYAAWVCRDVLLEVPCVKSVSVIDASEFRAGYINREHVYVLVSQSGETLDIIQAFELLVKAKCHAQNIIGITNTMMSQLYRKTSCVCLNAGKEVAVAATKSFSSQILGTLYLFEALRPRLHNIKFNQEDFLRIESQVRQVVKQISPVTKSMFVLGSHSRFALSCEAALKIKELTYIHAEALETGSLKHGPLALVEPGVHVILLFPPQLDHRYISTCREIQTRGGTVIAVCNKFHKLPGSTLHLKCEKNDDVDLLLEQLLNIQYFSYYLAIERGINPDRPRNLAKTVTVS